MSKKNDKRNVPSIRSSAAEYLTYVASVGDSTDSMSYLTMRLFGLLKRLLRKCLIQRFKMLVST